MAKSATITLTNMQLNKPFKRYSVGCLILSADNKILLQRRDPNCERFPSRLATFGGDIEKNEQPIEALIRELQEELGAQVEAPDVTSLGAITEAETQHTELIYLYFWHDKRNTITGCYEGKAHYINDPTIAETDPSTMEDVRWLLQQSKKRKLL